MKERIVILGGGESGTGAALLANAHGYDVFLSDAGVIADTFKKELNEHEISYEEQQHTERKILSAVEAVKSPGIPDDAEIVKKIHNAGIPVISEIEFAARYTDAKLLAITGTNGKTTTTLLVHHLLKEGGYYAGLAGNVGFSLAKQVYYENYDYYALEISSFQLDGVYETQFDAAALLNITPDHLNRYDNDLQKYVASKFRVSANMDTQNLFVYNADDQLIRDNLKSYPSKCHYFPVSIRKADDVNAWSDGSTLNFNEVGQVIKLPIDEMPLRGDHNMLNIMSAVALCRHVGLPWEQITLALRSFKNMPHRLEFVGEINGVRFYNDSKATNVDAVYYALGSFNTPIVWIAGGTDKGNDYKKIDNLVRNNVKALVALGKDNKKLLDHFSPILSDCLETHDINDAVNEAFKMAGEGDIVLLSPACASFDLFKNYEERGMLFKKAVEELKGKVENNLMLML